jgi:hypothetical protein
MFLKKGQGKFRNEFMLKLGVEKMPPSIYNEHGEIKPNSTTDPKWLAFTMGDDGAFWEWSLWKTEEEARERVGEVKNNYSTVKFLDQFCACGHRILFEIEDNTLKRANGMHRELDISQVDCECQKPKPKSPGKAKAETPTKKSPVKPKEPEPEKKLIVKRASPKEPEPERKLVVKRGSPKKKVVEDDDNDDE